MSLADNTFTPVRTTVYEIVGNFFKAIAGLFGYPENPGMPTVYNKPNISAARMDFLDNLPWHRTSFPPRAQPQNWFEMLFGTLPKPDIITKYFYESKQEGFYNFYITNYKNMYFLPDWLSEFIQVRLHICLDISVLEIGRELIFMAFIVYHQIVALRIALGWYVILNPYTFPWYYITTLVDWIDEGMQGFVPSVLGVNITSTLILTIIGAIADSLNHLVFTMPFLPSEAQEAKMLVNEQMTDTLVFHYLPILWYRYPIPNEIREFWYNERPDILKYMQQSYKDLEIQFLPDRIVNELNQQILKTELPPIDEHLIDQSNSISHYMSTEVLTKIDPIQPDQFIINLTHFNQHFHDFLMTYVDKLL